MQDIKYISTQRSMTILTIILLTFSIFTARLFYLQLLKGHNFKNRAENNEIKNLVVPPYRSIVYDRNKTLKLAYNKPSIALTVTRDLLPKDKKEKQVLIKKIALFLNKTPKEIQDTISNNKIDDYTPIVLEPNASIKTIAQFAEKIDEFPGIFWENRPQRVYPFKESSFHIVGYTGMLNEEEMSLYKGIDEYFSDSIVGKSGIEKEYDKSIRGKSGILLRSVNATGQVLQQEIFKDPIQGDHIVLAVDARLQKKAYDLMQNFVGSVIISKITTGEILALVSTPSIDPSIFHNTLSAKNQFLQLKSSPQNPFFNRAIQGRYAPASAFKLVVSAAFLNEGIDPKKSLLTSGSYKVGNRIFKDWRNNGRVDMKRAIGVSANVYYYYHSQIIGRQPIFQMAKEFGMTTPYQIDLPNENVGFLPNDKWFEKVHKRRWSVGDTANISIGQGDVLTTPLEIHMITTAIANGGIIYKPYILKERLSFKDKSLLWKQEPIPLKIMNVAPHIFTLLQEGMHEVIYGEKGTAQWLHRCNLIKVPIAGKTGTAQVGSLKDNNGLFTAYAPYGKKYLDDAVAVTVLLEETNTGSAVRIVAELFNYYFGILYPNKNPNYKGS